MSATFLNAFPARLNLDVTGLAQLLDPPAALVATNPFSVVCDGESLLIPQRIYGPPISDNQFASLCFIEQLIAACWFTRHHDGHVRERFLRHLQNYRASWVIAYVVVLCGEYVIELLQYIWERRELFDAVVLGRWLNGNEEFYSKTRARITSYWDCYYRSSCAQFDGYVGRRLITFFDECRSKAAV